MEVKNNQLFGVAKEEKYYGKVRTLPCDPQFNPNPDPNLPNTFTVEVSMKKKNASNPDPPKDFRLYADVSFFFHNMHLINFIFRRSSLFRRRETLPRTLLTTILS